MDFESEDARTFYKDIFKRHVDKCYFLIHHIIDAKWKQENAVDDFTRLQKDLLQKIVSKPTLEMIMSVLEDIGVIEINHSFFHNFSNPFDTTENFCKGYKLTESYVTQPLVYVSAGKLSKKIESCMSQKTEDLLKSSHHPEHQWQRQWFISEKYDVDAVTYSKLVDKFLQDGKTLDGEVFNPEMRNIYKLQMNKLKVGLPEYNIFPHCDRVGTSFAFANQYVRPFIKVIEVKPEGTTSTRCLMQIDFTASHALHLIKVISENLGQGYPYITKERRGRGGSLYTATPRLNEIDRAKLASEMEFLKDKVMNYKKDIYQYLADRYEEDNGYRVDDDPNKERDIIKDLWNQSFICGYYINTRNNPKWIKSVFPEISKYIETVGYKPFATELMKSEATLLNARIIRRICRTYRNCLLFGLFDAVVFDGDYFEGIQEIMYDESEKYFGFPVKLKTHDYTEDLKRYNEYLLNDTRSDELIPVLSATL